MATSRPDDPNVYFGEPKEAAEAGLRLWAVDIGCIAQGPATRISVVAPDMEKAVDAVRPYMSGMDSLKIHLVMNELVVSAEARKILGAPKPCPVGRQW